MYLAKSLKQTFMDLTLVKLVVISSCTGKATGTLLANIFMCFYHLT